MIGHQVSHYRILERLGGGGMGEVFRAEDLRLGRTVALKFLPPAIAADEEAKQRLVQEARSASALDHPNVCTLFEIDETSDGRLFLAMAYCPGETLKRRLVAGELPLDKALAVTTQVARGLAKAHAAGIVHRDVKPANLMLTRDGVVKIVDFGLAKLADSPALTRTGRAIGTPLYMSPEQVRGDEVDGRTDLWSLGVVLYEMLAGRPPFAGDSDAAVLSSILHDEPPPLAAVRPDLPPEVRRLVDDLLVRDRDERLSSAQQLLERLDAVRAGSADAEAPTLTELPVAEVEETASGTTTTEVPPRRHRLRVAVVGAAVALAVLGGFAALRWLGGAAEGPATEPPAAGTAVAEAGRRMIVVLPFKNLGPPEHEYFAAGMTEEITSRLAAFEVVGVISRTTAIRYAGSGKSIGEIGDEIGVDWVLEGTVRWAPSGDGGAGRVRITPQLVRVADDLNAWADNYDAPLEDVFAVQADIAEQVIAELEVVLTRGGGVGVEAVRPTENLEAYNAYLRGLHHVEDLTSGPANIRMAVASFERAVELDPAFALAWARVAGSRCWLYQAGVERSPENRASAAEAAGEALRLAPELPEVHLSVGFFHYHCGKDYRRALEEVELARLGLPNSSKAKVLLGYIERRRGRWGESTASLEEALRLDPLSTKTMLDLSYSYILLGRYTEASRLIEAALALEPSYAYAHIYRSVVVFLESGDALAAHRLFAEAPTTTQKLREVRAGWLFIAGELEAALEESAELGEHWSFVQFRFPSELLRGWIEQALGREGAARRSFTAALAALEGELADRPDDPHVHVGLAFALAGLGRGEEAVRHAERAVELLPVSEDAIEGNHLEAFLAEVYSRVGEPAAACDAVDDYLSRPALFNLHWFEQHPGFAAMRADPCFAEVRRRHPVTARAATG